MEGMNDAKETPLTTVCNHEAAATSMDIGIPTSIGPFFGTGHVVTLSPTLEEVSQRPFIYSSITPQAISLRIWLPDAYAHHVSQEAKGNFRQASAIYTEWKCGCRGMAYIRGRLGVGRRTDNTPAKMWRERKLISQIFHADHKLRRRDETSYTFS